MTPRYPLGILPGRHAIKTFFAPLFCLAALPATVAAQSPSEVEDIQTEFEVAFLADQFGAIRLPVDRDIAAGTILSLDTYTVFDRIENCLDDFEDRYTRSDTRFRMTSRNRARSGTISAETRSLFDLQGEVAVSVSSAMTDEGSFDLESDDIVVEAHRAEDILYDDRGCGYIRDAVIYRYLPEGLAYVDKAFYFAGDVTHSYELALSGSGSGSIGTGRLAEFMAEIPFLERIAPYFDLTASVSVGGESLDSGGTRLGFGATSAFPVGFLPRDVNANVARQIVDRVEEIGGAGTLALAMGDPNAAAAFLDDFPEFSLESGESLLGRALAGEELTPYSAFRLADVDRSSLFAEIMSRLLTINRLAATG